jgi:hypothetical protein
VPAGPSSELGGLQWMGTAAGTAGLGGGQAAKSSASDRFLLLLMHTMGALCFCRYPVLEIAHVAHATLIAHQHWTTTRCAQLY